MSNADRDFARARRTYERRAGWTVADITADDVIAEGFHAERIDGTYVEQVQVVIVAPAGRRKIRTQRRVIVNGRSSGGWVTI